MMQISFGFDDYVNCDMVGISFEGVVDNSRVVCIVSIEALQDIEPRNNQGSTEARFVANRTFFEQIAEQKIRMREARPIRITSADVRANRA